MSVLIAVEQDGIRGIIEYRELDELASKGVNEVGLQPFPNEVGITTDVTAMTFRGESLFVAAGNKIYEFNDARDLSNRQPPRTLPAGFGIIHAMAFEPDLRTLWIIEDRPGAANPRDRFSRVRFTDLSDLTANTRYSTSDSGRVYRGMAIIGTTMYVVAYPFDTATQVELWKYTGDDYGTRSSSGTRVQGLNAASGLAVVDGTKLLIVDRDRTMALLDTPDSSGDATTYGPYAAALPVADAVAWADLDPIVDTGVPARPLDISIGYVGRALLTPPLNLDGGSPFGRARRITQATIGLFRSRGGSIRQRGMGEFTADDSSPLAAKLVTDLVREERGEDHPSGRSFTGELTIPLHDLGTDPTASIIIEQSEPEDLEVTHLGIDIQSED